MGNIEDLVNGMEFEESSGIYEHIICIKCMTEVKESHPFTTPEEYGRLAIGWLSICRLGVWCLRHNRLVASYEVAPGEYDGPIPI